MRFAGPGRLYGAAGGEWRTGSGTLRRWQAGDRSPADGRHHAQNARPAAGRPVFGDVSSGTRAVHVRLSGLPVRTEDLRSRRPAAAEAVFFGDTFGRGAGGAR